MITPEELKRKGERLYPQAVAAWLAGDATFFPRHVPADLKVPTDTSKFQAINQLRESSKQRIGYGYTVYWKEIKSRLHSENSFPVRIEFDSMDDLVKFIGNRRAHELLCECRQKILDRLPSLEGWLKANWRKALNANASLDDLLAVTKYLIQHPRPDCYLRELPLAVPTKVIEQNKTLLAEWFDLVLPNGAIDFGMDRKKFEGRYGFRSPRSHLLLRALDPTLMNEWGMPTDEWSMPVAAIALLPARDLRVIIVENKINLLTLPARERTLAFGRLGFGVTQLFDVPWLAQQKLHYWGDLDVQGFEILALLRSRLPHAQSWLMNPQVLRSYQHLATTCHYGPKEVPEELTDEEREAFKICRDENLRLEQEHLPQSLVLECF